jgi:hypothetical protein
MADHLKPTITSTYSNFVTELDGRFDDLAVGLDPAVTTATNLPTGSIRWVSASNKWQKYNGAAYVDLSSLYSISISGNSGTVTNGVYTNGSYANPTFIASLSGTKITGDISGNSGSSTKLFTARNINGVAFDGTAAISLNLNTNLTFNNSGSGSASGIIFNGGTATTISYNTVGAASVLGVGASGSWGISVTGSSSSLSTARNLTIGATSKSFNGSADVTWSVAEIVSVTDSLSVNTVATVGNISSGGNITATGNITANGNITASSDETLKTNWRYLPQDFIENLAKVKHGVYDRIDSKLTQVGVSAQSLQKVSIESVFLGDDGKLSVAYGNAALVAAIQLANRVVELESRIKMLENNSNKTISTNK